MAKIITVLCFLYSIQVRRPFLFGVTVQEYREHDEQRADDKLNTDGKIEKIHGENARNDNRQGRGESF